MFLVNFSSAPRIWHYALLAAIAGIALLAGNADLPLIDRDEPRFAQATREMIQRHEWLIPYFNGEYRFDKPVLSYWLMGAAYFLLGGENEFGARFPSAVTALCVAWIIYEIGRRRLNVTIGLSAAAAWLVCLQVLIHGRMAVADMPLILATTLANWAIWELLHKEYFDRRWFAILYFALAFGFLTKGPIAFICPLTTLLLFRWVFWRKNMNWQNLRLTWGLPFSLLLIGLWGVPALIESEGLFWHQGMGKHVLERGIKPFNDRAYTPFFYLRSLPLSLFPAIAFVGGVAAAVRCHWDAWQAYLLAWFIGPCLIFTFYSTQLSHYVLPAFPAAFLLLAEGAALPPGLSRWRGPLFYLICTLALGTAGVLGGIALLVDFAPEMSPLRPVVGSVALILFGLTALAWLAKQRWWCATIVAVIMVGLGLQQAGAGLRLLSPAVRLEGLMQSMPAQTRYWYSGYEEPSLVFYSNRRWERLPAEAAVSEILSAQGPCFIVLLREEIRLNDYLSRALPILHPTRIKPPSAFQKALLSQLEDPNSAYRAIKVAGVNPARLSWVRVDAWYKP